MAVYKFRGLFMSNNTRLFKSTREKSGFIACGQHSHSVIVSSRSSHHTWTSNLQQISQTERSVIKGTYMLHKKHFSKLCNISNSSPDTVILLSLKSNGVNIQSVRWRRMDNEEEILRMQRDLHRSRMRAQLEKETRDTTVLKLAAIAFFFLGATYASVPLYRVFCQKTGRGGKAVQGQNEKIEKMKPGERELTILFIANVDSTMRWNFKPQQAQVKVRPGETALAFYTATNPCDKPIIGISTYTVTPWEAGAYFNKIQCFCFEEQRLNPGEQVDMPVFFYIDPDLEEDPSLETCTKITLSYTFFESKDPLSMPYPGYSQTVPQPTQKAVTA